MVLPCSRTTPANGEVALAGVSDPPPEPPPPEATPPPLPAELSEPVPEQPPNASNATVNAVSPARDGKREPC